MGSANQPYVNFFFIKKFQGLISGLAGNADPHLGMRQDIGLQPGKKNISAERGTGSDTELRNVSGTVMKDGTFSFIDKLKGCLYFFKKNFSVRGKGNSSGVSFKKQGVKVVFKLLYSTAYSGLADVQFFCGSGNTACFSCNIENMIKG